MARLGGLASGCAVVLAASTNATASTTIYPTMAPGPLVVNAEGCIEKNVYGGMRLLQPGASTCPFSVGGASGWSPWRGGEVNVPWTPNPGGGITAWWTTTVPANTEFRARMVLLTEEGVIASVGNWVNGGGGKVGGTDRLGDGPLFINFQMRAFRAATSGPVPTPVLNAVAGEHYFN